MSERVLMLYDTEGLPLGCFDIYREAAKYIGMSSGLRWKKKKRIRKGTLIHEIKRREKNN